MINFSLYYSQAFYRSRLFYHSKRILKFFPSVQPALLYSNINQMGYPGDAFSLLG